jgi:8-oxo-dGTP pyrophosphatase MutT (NUDIX family)
MARLLRQVKSALGIRADHIRSALDEYLDRHPDEVGRLKRLLDAMNAGSEISSRTNFEGHVTCGAVLLDPAARVLHVHHNALRRWLLPGGHLEDGDVTLAGAALRELSEETGISSAAVKGLGNSPIDIDAHLIPANPFKQEPEHWHFDFRYAFRGDGRGILLQADEVSSYRWLAACEIPATGIARRLSGLS